MLHTGIAAVRLQTLPLLCTGSCSFFVAGYARLYPVKGRFGLLDRWHFILFIAYLAIAWQLALQLHLRIKASIITTYLLNYVVISCFLMAGIAITYHNVFYKWDSP
jgi:hypothetical protein